MSEIMSNLPIEDSMRFYTDAQDYWETVPATVDGVLGGFGHLDQRDARDSLAFLSEFVKGKMGANKVILNPPSLNTGLACDCGAGIGRVSKRVLLRMFDKVDLVEPDAKFLEKSKEYLGHDASRVSNFICKGLQDFEPGPETYDLIWCQWVLSHLTDQDLLSFLKRAIKGLRSVDGKSGMIGVKENVARFERLYDAQDSSVTRTEEEFKALFEQAGLQVLKEGKQTDFPEGLYPVGMWMLKPK